MCAVVRVPAPTIDEASAFMRSSVFSDDGKLGFSKNLMKDGDMGSLVGISALHDGTRSSQVIGLLLAKVPGCFIGALYPPVR